MIIMAKSLAVTVNMSQPELRAWKANWRRYAASTATGQTSLDRLADGDHFFDEAFAAKVDNFNARHLTQQQLFGAEVQRTGWSKRAIALRNWGHDPSKVSSPAYDADLAWLDDHPGAGQRRTSR